MTPTKIYDPNNEFDEEYFEFGLFMSRREYKTIKKRLQRGKLASANEGKWVCSTPPFGYDRIKLKGEKGYILKINESEAKIIKYIFSLCHKHKLGAGVIAKQLNGSGFKTRCGGKWTVSTIHDILSNPHYIGMIRYNNRVTTKKIVEGNIVTQRHKYANQNVVYVKGRHEAIISPEIFNEVQEIRLSKSIPRNVYSLDIVNPLAGLVKCKKCGYTMVKGELRGRYRLNCKNKDCNNVGDFLEDVENTILSFLEMWLKDIKLVFPKSNLTEDITIKKDLLKSKEEYLETCKQKQNRIYDLFEEQIYDNNTFLERSKIISKDIDNTLQEIKKLKNHIKDMENVKIDNENFIPNLKNVLENYKKTKDVNLKNQLLKSVIDKVYYQKDKASTRWKKEPFELWVLPKINSNFTNISSTVR